MALIIKCLSKGCRNNDIDKYLFRNLEKDKACIYYLQRILACKCNERFYNIKNNDYFILDRKSY